jgi:hypothetical protein
MGWQKIAEKIRFWFNFLFWTVFLVALGIFLIFSLSKIRRESRQALELANNPRFVNVPPFSQAMDDWRDACNIHWQEHSEATEEQVEALRRLNVVYKNNFFIPLPQMQGWCADFKIYKQGLRCKKCAK